MLQDVNNKRFTEIDSINGAIVTAGNKLGLPTPVNAELVEKVKEIEQNY
jgi:2-dehydropantoate 2-reductase